jgi:hypothetical protein
MVKLLMRISVKAEDAKRHFGWPDMIGLLVDAAITYLV